MRALSAILLLLCWPVAVVSQTLPAERALSGEGLDLLRREVERFDFDEPDNPLPIPQYWVRISDDGFPLWNTVEFNPTPRAGRAPDTNARTYRMRSIGGDVGIRLVPGIVPVLPETDYILGVNVRTEGVTRAGARLRAYLLAEDGRILPGSLVETEPVRTGGQWSEVSLHLPGRSPEAAWIGVELLIEQPEPVRGEPTLDPNRLVEDLNAAAEFDELVIWRMPRVEVAVEPGRVSVGGASPRIAVDISDVSTSDLSAHLEVRDLSGQVIASQVVEMRLHPDQWTWEPALAGYGFHSGSLTLLQDGAPFAHTTFTFAWLPPEDAEARGRASDFGLILKHDTETPLGDLRTLAAALGPKRFTLPIWHAGLTPESMETWRGHIKAVIAALPGNPPTLTFSLDQLPEALAAAARLRPEQVAEALASAQTAVMPYLDEFLFRYGQLVADWQIGPASSSRFHLVGDPGPLLHGASAFLREAAPVLSLSLPWPADYDFPVERAAESAVVAVDVGDGGSAVSQSQLPAGLTSVLWIAAGIRPESIRDYLAQWSDSTAPFRAGVEALNTEHYGGDGVVIDLVKRIVLAAEAGATEFDLEAPWRLTADARGLEPTETYAAIANLSRLLSGCRPYDRLALGEGVTAIIFMEEDRGVLAMWNDSVLQETVETPIYLGREMVSVIDVQGNRRAAARGDDGRHRLQVGRSPIFVEGADLRLAMFRAGFRLEPEFVQADAAVHHHEISLHNPWPSTITGEIRVLEPASWNFQQRVQSFSLRAGETARLPFSFSFPRYELAGRRDLEFLVRLQTDRELEFRIDAGLEIGFRNVTLNAGHHWEEDEGGDPVLVVTHEIVNRSSEAVWIRTYAIAPGFPVQEADVAGLEPNQTAFRVFRYSGAGIEALRGRFIRVGLRDVDGAGRINLRLDIH